MQVKYNTFSAPAGGCKVSSTRSYTKDAKDIPYMLTDKVMVDGYLEGSGQAALTALEKAMKSALLTPGQDLLFLCDDGSQSATCLLNASSLSGVRITDGPHFKDVMGPEYVTQRHFEFTAEADYAVNGMTPTTLIEASETLKFSGGGPLYITKPAIWGPPQRQKVYEQTVSKAIQSGYAVAFGGDQAPHFPEVPGPIWPFALIESPDVTYPHPKRMGRLNYGLWRIEWEYKFEWPAPLVGIPNLWRG